MRYGHSSYISRQGALWVTFKAFKVAALPPVGLSGLAYLYGYARAWVRSAPRVEDPEFARYRPPRPARPAAGTAPDPRIDGTRQASS